MHNMALALKQAGHDVSGSDDEIFEPSRSRLDQAGLLPEEMGWNDSRIHESIDLVILGMHAREDNPELIKAAELGIKIMSFPEFVAEQSREKIRVVVAGSHGKTTTTAMIMHVLKEQGVDFDYLVGSQLDGFETMVRFSDAPIMVIEGDEYLSSPIDRRPKFLWYRPHYSIITGIAWDHINVFPTFENYVSQFHKFIDSISAGGSIFYYKHDAHLEHLLEGKDEEHFVPYEAPVYQVVKGKNKVRLDGKDYTTSVVGKHNLENMMAALEICVKLGIDRESAMNSLAGFKGTARRLETWVDKSKLLVFRDFAHSPSKLRATVSGVQEQYPNKEVIAFFELHTFSSLKKEFIPLYSNTMEKAHEAYVFFHPHVFEMKKMPMVSSQFVEEAFGDVTVLNETWKLHDLIQEKVQQKKDAVILLMSSGTFDGFQKDLLLSWL